jgi:catechol 2,3-dioxygenase-like lactoylglutathione lyase family enzyme
MNLIYEYTKEEKAMTSSNDFPTAGVELRHLLVVSNYARSLAFYRDVLGATVVREFPGTLCFLSFGGSQVLLTVPGGPTQDKPTVTFASPADADRVSSELAIRVPDCSAAYEVLRSRGAEFLTEPVDWGYEVRAFFRDPDGHLLELSQTGQQKSQAGELV